MTVGFDHYNAPVAVTVPPASQTTDVSSIISSVQGMASDIGTRRVGRHLAALTAVRASRGPGDRAPA